MIVFYVYAVLGALTVLAIGRGHHYKKKAKNQGYVSLPKNSLQELEKTLLDTPVVEWVEQDEADRSWETTGPSAHEWMVRLLYRGEPVSDWVSVLFLRTEWPVAKLGPNCKREAYFEAIHPVQWPNVTLKTDHWEVDILGWGPTIGDVAQGDTLSVTAGTFILEHASVSLPPPVLKLLDITL